MKKSLEEEQDKRTIPQLINAIKEKAHSSGQGGSDAVHHQNLGYIIADFATILWKLGRRAELLTWWIIILTVALTMLTILQFCHR